MTDETFIKEIYEPYNEAYKLLKMIKDCGPDDSEEIWNAFTEKLDGFTKEHDTKMRHAIARMLTDAADIVAKMNREEKADVQELHRGSHQGRRAV